MTTKVTVEAHAGWPVQLEFYDPTTLGEYGVETVPANESRTVYIHKTKAMRLIELEGVKDV